jgi:hypothetical protein
MTEEPKYHCRACARENALGRIAEESVHRARRDAIEGIVIAVVAILVVLALLVGAVAGALAVFG